MTTPFLTDFDLHLLAEGTHYRTYNKLGAHLAELDGQPGTHFAVWAPNAKEVSVIGDFNGWRPEVHPMRFRPEAGVWECFIPEVGKGALYKYFIRSRYHKYEAEKADPYQRAVHHGGEGPIVGHRREVERHGQGELHAVACLPGA